jgi:hypothetical protein
MMNASTKQRDYHPKPHLSNSKTFVTKFAHSHGLVYPQFICFFNNLKYLVKLKYKYFSHFSRAIKSARSVTITDRTVNAYLTGYFQTAQINWLALIADFMGESLTDMLTVDFSERDANKAEQ